MEPAKQFRQPQPPPPIPAAPLSYAAPAPPIPFASTASPASAAPGISAAAAPHPGFSPEQLLAINDARKRFKPIRREISITNFYAWSVAIFAGLTLVCSITSPSGLLVGLGLGVFAFVEYKTLPRLQALDPDAPKTLALNHAGLAALLILYAAYCLVFAGSSEAFKDAVAQNPELANSPILASADNIAHLITVLVYSVVLAVALFGEGSVALYHLSRRKLLIKYLSTTPPWILPLHQAGLMR